MKILTLARAGHVALHFETAHTPGFVLVSHFALGNVSCGCGGQSSAYYCNNLPATDGSGQLMRGALSPLCRAQKAQRP
jgi:hypothetical protein